MATKLGALSRQVDGDHYKGLPIEPAFYNWINKIPWNEGEAIKLISRHKHKNGAKDLLKAIHYIQMVLEWEYHLSVEISDPEDVPQHNVSPLHDAGKQLAEEAMKQYLWSPLECVEREMHLTSCDDDGYCNLCGTQESAEELKEMWKAQDEKLDLVLVSRLTGCALVSLVRNQVLFVNHNCRHTTTHVSIPEIFIHEKEFDLLRGTEGYDGTDWNALPQLLTHQHFPLAEKLKKPKPQENQDDGA